MYSSIRLANYLNQFSARPHNGMLSRVYLGLNGPKYLLPTSDVQAARLWLYQRYERQSRNMLSDWRLWTMIILCLVLMVGKFKIDKILIDHVLGTDFEHLSLLRWSIVSVAILFGIWFIRNEGAAFRRAFALQFPAAIAQKGRFARTSRMMATMAPWWLYALVLIVFIIPLGALFVAELSPARFTPNSFTIITASLTLLSAGFAFGLWTRLSFRIHLGRKPENNDLAQEIDWFDGIRT